MYRLFKIVNSVNSVKFSFEKKKIGEKNSLQTYSIKIDRDGSACGKKHACDNFPLKISRYLYKFRRFSIFGIKFELYTKF